MFRKNFNLASLAIVCLTVLSPSVASAQDRLLHVDEVNGSGSGDGLSWNSAMKHLQDALVEAHSYLAIPQHAQHFVHIWVAQGTYYPDRDANNPNGIDLIVFGNTFNTSGGFWTNGDPRATVLSSSNNQQPARVSVSQDGITWHVYTSGPFADSHAPTLGRHRCCGSRWICRRWPLDWRRTSR